MQRGKVSNPAKAYQPFDFSMCLFDRGITPTDIDFSVDISTGAFLVGEFKNQGAELPRGQRLHLQRVADSHARGGSDCFVFVAEHSTPEGIEVDAGAALVREYYWNGHWRKPKGATAVIDVCEWFAGKHDIGLHKGGDPWI